MTTSTAKSSPSVTLHIGDKAPDFDTVSETGEAISLASLRGKRVVIYFYPKDNTPGCTTQSCLFRDNISVFEDSNAVVLGVSGDSKESHVKFRDKFDLPFPLLVDEDNTISKAYGVWGDKSMYGRLFKGITRSHFVIDEAGILIDVQYKISPKNSVKEALKTISQQS